MEKFDLNNIFQGISTLLQSDPAIMYARIGLILLGILLVYLGPVSYTHLTGVWTSTRSTAATFTPRTVWVPPANCSASTAATR